MCVCVFMLVVNAPVFPVFWPANSAGPNGVHGAEAVQLRMRTSRSWQKPRLRLEPELFDSRLGHGASRDVSATTGGPFLQRGRRTPT